MAKVNKPTLFMFKREIVEVINGKLVRTIKTFGPVRILAEAEGYSMVRRKGAMPCVVPTKDIIKEPVNE